VTFRDAQKTGFPRDKNPDAFFGQARKPAKIFRAGLYARISTADQVAPEFPDKTEPVLRK
jgi:hypothetical protein